MTRFDTIKANPARPSTGTIAEPEAISKMRIMHVITRFVNGGADENTMLTCNYQAEAGHDVWLVHGGEATDRMLSMLHPAVRAICVKPLVREVSPSRDLSALFALFRLFRGLRPDVVHTHTSKAGIVGRLAALAVPKARVFHGVHILPFTNEPFPKRLVYILLEKIAAFRTHAFIDVSEGMRDLCLEYGLGRERNHYVIRSGMDVARFQSADPSDDLRAMKYAHVLIGYVAVLERRKRHRELLSSLMPLMKKVDSVILVLAGEGPERSIIEEMIEEEGLADRVCILGFRDDVERVLASCDICVFVSEREGLPRSIVQYVLAGQPIVATRLPGIERVVVDGENGYVVPSDDFSAFSDCVEKLVLDEALRTQFATASAATDLSEWNARVMTDLIEEVYARYCDGNGSGTDGSKLAMNRS